MADEEDMPLVPDDPESEGCFDALKARIAWELAARIAVGDDPRTPEGRDVLSSLIADAVLDAFVLRERTAPRYHRGAPH
jgi:hypothetical protein